MAPRTKRLSAGALAAAMLAVGWALIDEHFGIGAVSAVLVSATTSLVMLVANFVDFMHADDDLYSGDEAEA